MGLLQGEGVVTCMPMHMPPSPQVLDTGCGIPKDKLATIFQAFSQVGL